MSFYRRAQKVDLTQAAIVDGLRACGYVVRIIGRPVDLLVRKPTWIPNAWILAECKSLIGKTPKTRIRAKEQAEQYAFCRDFDVPYWSSFEQAKAYLDVRSIELEKYK